MSGNSYNDSIKVLGCKIHPVTMEQALDRIAAMVGNGSANHVITLNAEIIYQAQYDPNLYQLINNADLVTPDGIGVVWGARWLGYSLKERVTGIDLLEHLCDLAPQQGWSLYLLGAAPGVAELAGEKLRVRNPNLNICGIRHGYFTDSDIPRLIDDINECRPDILLVALGAPRQEFFINSHKESLSDAVCIGVGGSFDVVAGIKERAPQWMIKLNLEWLYRLISEPVRWQRQLALPKFMVLVLRHRWQSNTD